MNNSIRIIGGLYRGKKIPVANVEGLRPTPDRVRETLFNWLMQDIHGARCLDAFAGSGALGLEAFSRGAAEVYFIEQSAHAHQHLKKIITQFASSKLHLLHQDTMAYLQQSQQQFDVIFLDPPFAAPLIPSCLQSIAQRQLLRPNGLVYVESASPIALEGTWQQLKLKQAGQVCYGLFTLPSPTMS